jgi:type IV pilus assembly protein PilM
MDFGAGTLKVAEFEPNDAGSLRLKQFAVRPLGQEGSQEGTREAALVEAIKEVLGTGGFSAKTINVCAPGFTVFSKFVKLPNVDAAKVTQIIAYEAQQNVPFPLDEVVWDYQILGSAASGELEVLLVAIKADVVETLFRTSEAAGLSLQLVDVSPAALCNAFRFNYGDLEGCTMLLDIGAKTSNLLFFEKGKVYSRSINIGANAITQDFAAESKLPFAEADRIKVAEGFVSLGGAYEEPDNPHQAAISKISRQVMTRLHIQMNQTIQFYRGQQGGSAPQRLVLAGGASLMPYTAQFFAEKLGVPVDYFNPFRNIELDPELNLEDVAKVAHTFGEVVGLGIRNLAECPVDLNLMPKSHRSRQQFGQKQPYFIATIFSLILVVVAYGWFYHWVADSKKAAVEKLKSEQLEDLEKSEAGLRTAMEDYVKNFTRANNFAGLLDGRSAWIEVISTIRHVLIQVEEASTTNEVQAAVWIEKFDPFRPVSAAPAPGGVPPPPQPINFITIQLRAMNLNQLAPDANTKFVFAMEQAFKTNAFFDAKGTQLGEKLPEVAPETLNFPFGLTLQLKKPIR